MSRPRSNFTPEPVWTCPGCGTRHESSGTLAYRVCYSGHCTVLARHTSSPAQPNIGTSSFAPNSSATAAVGLTQPAVAQPAQRRHTLLPAQPNTGTSSFAPNASAATAVTPRRPRPGPQPVYTLSSHGFYLVRGNPDGSSRNPGNARRGYYKCGYCEERRSKVDTIKIHLLQAHREEYNRLHVREYQAHSAR